MQGPEAELEEVRQTGTGAPGRTLGPWWGYRGRVSGGKSGDLTPGVTPDAPWGVAWEQERREAPAWPGASREGCGVAEPGARGQTDGPALAVARGAGHQAGCLGGLALPAPREAGCAPPDSKGSRSLIRGSLKVSRGFAASGILSWHIRYHLTLETAELGLKLGLSDEFMSECLPRYRLPAVRDLENARLGNSDPTWGCYNLNKEDSPLPLPHISVLPWGRLPLRACWVHSPGPSKVPDGPAQALGEARPSPLVGNEPSKRNVLYKSFYWGTCGARSVKRLT